MKSSSNHSQGHYQGRGEELAKKGEGREKEGRMAGQGRTGDVLLHTNTDHPE